MKREGGGDNDGKRLISHSSSMSDQKSDEKLPKHKSDCAHDCMVTDPSNENKVEDSNRKLEAVIDCRTVNSEALSCHSCPVKQEMAGSEGPMETEKGFSDIDGSDNAEDPSKSETTLCPHKMLSRLGKSSSSSITKPEIPASDHKYEQTENPDPLVKHGVMEDFNAYNKKESNRNDIVKDEGPRKSQKERLKSSSTSNLKAMHSSKSSHTVLRQVSADSKDLVNSSSSKTSAVHQTGTNLGLSESDESLPRQKSSHAQKKSSSVPQKAEKNNQTNLQPSTKANQNPMPSPSPISNSSAMLSDEEV